VPLSIQKSTANYVVADSEIEKPKTEALPIQRWATKNFAAANSEIDSKKLHRCRFRNQQPKTVLLPIQKSAMRTAPLSTHKSKAKLCRCQFRNQQPIRPLPIQRSAAKNCIAADSEIGNENCASTDS